METSTRKNLKTIYTKLISPHIVVWPKPSTKLKVNHQEKQAAAGSSTAGNANSFPSLKAWDQITEKLGRLKSTKLGAISGAGTCVHKSDPVSNITPSTLKLLGKSTDRNTKRKLVVVWL